VSRDCNSLPLAGGWHRWALVVVPGQLGWLCLWWFGSWCNLWCLVAGGDGWRVLGDVSLLAVLGCFEDWCDLS
jgi:hypothetical protein